MSTSLKNMVDPAIATTPPKKQKPPSVRIAVSIFLRCWLREYDLSLLPKGYELLYRFIQNASFGGKFIPLNFLSINIHMLSAHLLDEPDEWAKFWRQLLLKHHPHSVLITLHFSCQRACVQSIARQCSVSKLFMTTFARPYQTFKGFIYFRNVFTF